MTKEQTFAWILLSIAFATQTGAADKREISLIADGINHSVPTEKELQTALSWLAKKGFVTKQEKKFSLTPEGQKEYENATQNTKVIFKIWENLEKQIINYL